MKFSWYERREFNELFDAELRPAGRFLYATSWFEATPKLVLANIPVQPVDTPPDGDDFPGPTYRWYGSVADLYFLLDMPSDEADETIVFPTFTSEPNAIPSIMEATLETFGRAIDGSHIPNV